jgi:2,5-diketo-D-gluconate reductase B
LVNNQIECHPYLDQSKPIAASRKRGLSVTAYSPIARGRVTGEAVRARIGKAHGKTATQVCLRYLAQHGVIVIPRTSRSERLKENFAIFDFKLTPAEMKEIAGLAHPGGRIVEWGGAPEWDD